MARPWRIERRALSLGLFLSFTGCERYLSVTESRPTPLAASAESHDPQKQPDRGAPPTTLHPEPGSALGVSELPADEAAASASGTETVAAASRLLIDEALAIGPAGPISADARGVVMVDRKSQVHIAKVGARSSALRPDRARFGPIDGVQSDYYAVARGPLVLRGNVYWISDEKLVRRGIDGAGPLEILATDARNGTRVTGVDVPGAPAHALYVSKPQKEDAPPRAKLWVEGAEPAIISPEGAGASSVAVARVGQDLFTVAIDARSAMTPLHGRRVRFAAGKPELDPDVVIWVGASSQTLSEVFALATPLGVRAFLPIERDVSHFGLVMLDLGVEPHMDPKAVWRGYPNGIDVAPVATGAFCDSAFVTYVRPEDPSPDAPERLEIAEINEAGLGPAELVSRARGFSNVSLGSAPNFAVLAYVADYQTFATTLRCKHRK